VPYSTKVGHDGQNHLVEIPNLAVARCANCGEMVLDDAANLRVSEEFRRMSGI